MQAQVESTQVLECGHAPSAHGTCDTGYSVNRETRARACYACSLAMDLAYAREHGKISGYVNSDATKITTWPGETLATIVHKREHRARWGNFGWQDAYVTYTARMADGTVWHGRGSRGMLTTMRRSVKSA